MSEGLPFIARVIACSPSALYAPYCPERSTQTPLSRFEASTSSVRLLLAAMLDASASMPSEKRAFSDRSSLVSELVGSARASASAPCTPSWLQLMSSERSGRQTPMAARAGAEGEGGVEDARERRSERRSERRHHRRPGREGGEVPRGRTGSERLHALVPQLRAAQVELRQGEARGEALCGVEAGVREPEVSRGHVQRKRGRAAAEAIPASARAPSAPRGLRLKSNRMSERVCLRPSASAAMPSVV